MITIPVLTFVLATLDHFDIISSWLKEPHVQEFWDNSPDHQDDILKFMHGRTEPSTYCDGLYTYWIALHDSVPYALIMTLKEKPEYDIGDLKKAHLSKTGHTYTLDYMIGNKNFVGKGLGASTLSTFVDFFCTHVDPKADTFFIDPDETNPRARHVYEKAGFHHVGDFIMQGDGSHAGRKSHLLIKKVNR